MSAADLPEIAFEHYTLDNGLDVILHQDRTLPIVAVNIWYHVGSKNEWPGRTGFAHLFEHMMFQGSKNWDDEFFAPLLEAGGTLNGSTSTDRTNYWEIVPSNFLERALWLEADRMGFLLEAMTQDKLDNQREVVKNERRQNYTNRPYGQAMELLVESAYPAGHPYSWTTIGSEEDLEAASLDDVRDFFRRFYHPGNASLAIGGDFEMDEAKEMVERHFGGLEPGPTVWRLAEWQPRFEAPRRVIAQDRVQLPRLYLGWHTPRFFSPDDASLDLLAGILGDGKSSRLYRSLVYERQIAQDVTVSQHSRELSGIFHIVATARDGHTTDELESAIDLEMGRLLADGPTAEELARLQTRVESDFVRALQKVGGFGGVTDLLNQYNHYIGDPGWFDRDLSRWLGVTVDDCRRVARSWLDQPRLSLCIEPQGTPHASASATARSVDRTVKPAGQADPSVRLPVLDRRRLASGLEIVVVEHRRLPLVSAGLVVRAGSANDPAERHGLAKMTAAMIDEGTESRSALEIADAVDRLGARLGLFASVDSSGASIGVLRKHQEPAFAILADVLRRPSFPDEELERQRARLSTQLMQERDRPEALARRVTARVLFGDAHPYGHDAAGDQDSIAAMTTDDVRGFWQRAWHPGQSTLVVVGDIDAATVERLASDALGDWAAADAAPPQVADANPATGRRIVVVDRPGATQSMLTLAHLGVARSTPDFFATLTMNSALGGMFTSRINMNLREDKGYTYGARSYFGYRLARGPFAVSCSVETKNTAPAVREVVRELEDVRGRRPLTSAELDHAKSALVRGFPRTLETVGDMAAAVREIVLNRLPDDHFNTYVEKIQAVTLDDANRAATEHIHPDQLLIVVVGDAKAIRDDLAALELGPIETRDLDGAPT